MARYMKTDFPLHDVRRHLETGPIVLVSSAWQGETDIMTMGWHMMLQFTPALFGCYFWEGNHSYELIRRSRECVINVPTADLADTVVNVGNSTGTELDKLEAFGLTAAPAEYVAAPLIDECYANFECRLADDRQIDEYGLFIWEIVKAHVAPAVTEPETLHYRGQGQFMVAGRVLDYSDRFKPQNL
ncbi:flavin reductase family protein [Pseudomonas sp. Marseille-QA0892]